MTDWEEIREKHAPMVWSTVARILKHPDDARDCFQDVLAEAIERNNREQVDDWGAFLRWLATRRAIDALRRRDRFSVVPTDLTGLSDSPSPDEQLASFNELVEVVRAELASLPDRQAEAFWLVCVEERTYEEVACQLNVDRNAVGVLVHRARRHMRTRLEAMRPVQSKDDSG